MKYIGSNAQQIFDHIRDSVVNGRLLAGDHLPSVRDLAQDLGVNRNTISSVYKRLTKAGITVSNGRLGTRISLLPAAGEQEGASDSGALIDLGDGNPKAEFLVDPVAQLSNSSFKPHLYGDAVVLPALEKIAHEYMAPNCPPDFSFTLTHGAIDAIDRLLAAHLVSGDKVIVEDPCFLGTTNLLRLAGMKSVGVAIDEQGIIISSLKEALKTGVRALIITPRAHNPTGFSLSKERAEQIKQVLQDYPNVLIIVDDHFSLVSMQDYFCVIPDKSNRWALIRSVSKGLGPDLRLAFVTSDLITAKLLGTKLTVGMNWVSIILQRIVVSCWHSTNCTDKLRQARLFYRQRQENVIQALHEQNIQVAHECDGLNVWIDVDVDEKELAFALAKRGWLVRVGSVFRLTTKGQAIRVTVVKLETELAQRFAKDLRSSINAIK